MQTWQSIIEIIIYKIWDQIFISLNYLNLLTDIDMSIMVGKGLRVGICHSIYWDAISSYKCMKGYDKCHI